MNRDLKLEGNRCNGGQETDKNGIKSGENTARSQSTGRSGRTQIIIKDKIQKQGAIKL